MELWLVLAFIPAIFWWAVSILYKIFVDRYLKSTYSFVFFSNILSLGFLVILFVFWDFEFIDLKYLFLVFLASLVYIIANFFYAESLKLEEASRVSPLLSFATVFMVFYDMFIFNRDINILWLIWIVIILLGSLLLLSNKFTLWVFRPRKILLLMMISSFLYSINFLISIVFLEKYSFYLFVTYQTLFQFLLCLCLLIFKKPRKKIFKSFRTIDRKWVYFWLGFTQFLDFAALFVLQYALILGVSSYVLAVGESQYLFILIFSIMLTLFKPHIFKEKMTEKILLRKSLSIILIIYWVTLIHMYG